MLTLRDTIDGHGGAGSRYYLYADGDVPDSTRRYFRRGERGLFSDSPTVFASVDEAGMAAAEVYRQIVRWDITGHRQQWRSPLAEARQ